MSPLADHLPDRDHDREREGVDALGLGGTFPRPGWVVIDAVRDAGFTGEVVCATTPAVRIHADRGRIYVAERSSDAPLSARLVDARALTAAELEQGVLRLGGAEHLGRLFERVPTVDRDAVLVATGLMTEDCLSWLATQHVAAAEATPYRHHPAGIHRWDPAPETPVPPVAPFAGPAMPAPAMPAPAMPAPASFAAPTASAPMPAPAFAPPAASLPAPVPSFAAPAVPAPLPAPAAFAPPAAAPAAPAPLAAPASVAAPPRIDTFSSIGLPPLRADAHDEVIAWAEPGFLDEPLPGEPSVGLLRPLRMPDTGAFADTDEPIGFPQRIDLSRFGLDPVEDELEADWIDRLDRDGLPAAGSDPLARPVSLPPLTTEPVDRFELIWPSGEIDEQFGGQAVESNPHPDRDRGGPTARLRLEGRPGRAALLQPLATPPAADADTFVASGGVGSIEQFLAAEAGRTAPSDPTRGAATGSGAEDVLESIRKAASSIAAGSLAPSERRTGPRVALLSLRDEQAGTAAAVAPATATGRMTRPNPAAGSVFDDIAPEAPLPVPVLPPAEHELAEDVPERVSALRRLIGNLRRH